MIRALSIRQPWAWLITNGGKNIENRKWKSNFRGDFLIHSPKKIDMEAFRKFKNILPAIDEIETGGIVGRAKITGCVSDSSSKWFRGPYGFLLEDAEPLPFTPCRGQLYFFRPDLP